MNQLPEYTDGGWSVATRVVDANTIHVGLMVWQGLPQGPVAHSGGCTSTGGYCWRSCRTTALAPTKTRQFVLRWMTNGQACGSTIPLGCFDPDGATGTISSGLLQLRSSAMAQTSGRLDDWAAVVAHEMIHGLGLAHYDSVYSGSYQLMRSTAGQLVPRLGDKHGMVRLALPGRLSATLTLPTGPVAAGQLVDATVTTASTGLGGIRSIVVACTDPSGVYDPIVTVRGVWDIVTTVRPTPWTVPATQTTSFTGSCRAVVRSKSSSVTSAPVSVQLGGPSFP